MNLLTSWNFSTISALCRRIFILIIACSGGFLVSGHAQQVSIKKVEIHAGGNIIIYYDLKDDDLDRKYSLYLYTSLDNYIQPLAKVTGEIGIDLSVGENKKIIWQAREEFGDDFKGGVALELKGHIYIPFITLDGFDDYRVLKRGKAYDITWTGGRGDNILIFELYQAENKVKVFEERPNVGNTSMTIPKDVKPGTYRFKIRDGRNRDEVVFTEDFQVKRKIPLVATIGVGVIIGAGVAVLVQMLSNNEENKIGDPPAPTK